jgi:transglutaminase/protease-like cytokinesis protein 3
LKEETKVTKNCPKTNSRVATEYPRKVSKTSWETLEESKRERNTQTKRKNIPEHVMVIVR